MRRRSPTQAKWRIRLGQLIATPSERKRIANELNLNSFSVHRWTFTDVVPRDEYLLLLPDLFPADQGNDLKALLVEEFPGLFVTYIPRTAIPDAFPTRLLSILSDSDEHLVSSAIAEMALQQLAQFLKRDSEPAIIQVLRCTPPQDHIVRSFHPIFRQIGMELDQLYAFQFCGANSLAAEALLSHGGVVSGDTFAISLRRRRKVAGCLVVTANPGHPLTDLKLDIIRRYADLLALMFLDDEFYALQHIQLSNFPAPEEQRALLKDQFGRVPGPFFHQSACLYSLAEVFLLEAMQKGQSS